MTTRYDCALNGTWLSEIAAEIIVTDVREDPSKVRTDTAQRPFGHGARVIRQRHQSHSVTVSFVIWEQDVQRRKEICAEVQQWAVHGGWLEINDRPGQRLFVVCETPPAISSALQWTRELSVGFTAYEQPFWMDWEETRLTVDASGSFYVPGSAPEALCGVDITNTGSDAVTSVTISAGDLAMTFSGISLPPGGVLSIGYDDGGVLFARIASTSVLAARTPESADDLIVIPGRRNDVSVSASGPVRSTFWTKGAYL